jgi:hypothetical protein
MKIDAESAPPTLKEVQQATQVLHTTSPDAESKRQEALTVIQKAADVVTPNVFRAFYLLGSGLSEVKCRTWHRKHPLLHFYDRAFDKVLQGVQAETPAPGEVFLWHLYNMGYVVKTCRHCFGIDLHHRRDVDLVPHLDFLAVTHNHNDHYTLALAKAMDQAGKPVFSNFFPNKGYSKEPRRTATCGEVVIHSYEADHNATLRKFIMPFEIVCDPAPGACVIFTGGDACKAGQLEHQSDPVDFFIVHPYVGLDVAEAATTTVQPAVTLISHLQELLHPVDQWRWTYADGRAACEKVRATGHAALMPVWGDKIVWSRRGTTSEP